MWQSGEGAFVVAMILIIIGVVCACYFLSIKPFNGGQDVGERIALSENPEREYWLEYHNSSGEYRRGVETAFLREYHKSVIRGEKP